MAGDGLEEGWGGGVREDSGVQGRCLVPTFKVLRYSCQTSDEKEKKEKKKQKKANLRFAHIAHHRVHG